LRGEHHLGGVYSLIGDQHHRVADHVVCGFVDQPFGKLNR